MSFVRSIRQFIRDEEGVTVIEYALLAALIGVALIGAMTALAGGVCAAFNSAITELGGTTVTCPA